MNEADSAVTDRAALDLGALTTEWNEAQTAAEVVEFADSYVSAMLNEITALRAALARPAEPAEGAEPYAWAVEFRDYHDASVWRRGSRGPFVRKSEAFNYASESNHEPSLTRIVPLYRLAAPGEQRPAEGRRIEGVAFQDGDNFCSHGDQSSWVFVPECQHESADEAANGVDLRATLILASPVDATRHTEEDAR